MGGESPVAWPVTVQSRVVVVFLDGVGIGSEDPSVNPAAGLKSGLIPFGEGDFRELFGEGLARKVDARLGVPGLPQSATGQTALFTGINAPRMIGRHLPGFPTKRLKHLISESSVMQQIKRQGHSVAFANCYTPKFFRRRSNWVSVTTAMCQSSQTRLRTLDDLASERGLFFDFTNRVLIDRGLEVGLFRPRKAARILAGLADRHHFCLYESFVSDLIGHRRGIDEAVAHLREIETFVTTLIEAVDGKPVSILVVSDHGNIEDMTTGSHTLNPVPLLVWGELRREFEDPDTRLSLCDITPRIVKHLSAANRS